MINIKNFFFKKFLILIKKYINLYFLFNIFIINILKISFLQNLKNLSTLIFLKYILIFNQKQT